MSKSMAGQDRSVAEPGPDNGLMKGELPRMSDASPEIPKTILKLDARSMVWAHDEVASDVEALSPFMAVALLLAVLEVAPMGLRMDASDFDGPTEEFLLLGVGVVLLLGCLAGIVVLLRISLFGSYADLHFNRRTRKIYTQDGKTQMQLDWKNVRPFAMPFIGPLQMGAPPLWSLTLIEFSEADPKVWVKQLRAQGLMPDRDACQRVWEAIRRYMDEPPESLPAQEVVPGPGRSWQAALLDFGPMREVGLFDSFDDMAAGVVGRLRKRHWIPPISPVRLLWWIVFWPGPLSTILYEKYRPLAKLPAEWLAEETPPPGEPNPYRRKAFAADEVEGRRKATRIIAWACGTCIAIGSGLTLWLLFAVVLPDMWKMWRPIL